MQTQEKNTRPRRLLTMITKLELGGAQQVVLNTLRGLDAQHYDRWLLAGQGGLLDNEARDLPGVRVLLWPSLRHPIRPCLDIGVVIRLVRLLRKEKIEIVHTHSSKAGILGRTAACLARTPIVLHTIHGWPFHDQQPALLRWLYIRLERWAARRTTHLVAVSESTRQKGLQNKIGRPEQYTVIYPGSDLQAFSPGTPLDRARVRAAFGFAPDAPLVGMVACLKPQKAPEDFVRAAALVAKHHPDVRFLLVGDGERRSAVEAEIRRLGLEQRVVLAGWRQDVPQLMRGFDLLALTSLWEGLPCVLAQAMSSRVPVVATAVDGTQDAIQDSKTGRLVPPGDPQAMADSLVELLRQPEQAAALQQAAWPLAAQYGLSSMLEKTRAVYTAPDTDERGKAR